MLFQLSQPGAPKSFLTTMSAGDLFFLKSYSFFFFLKILFIYFRMAERERAHKQGEWQAEGEAGSPLSREPDEGLDLRTLGS